MTFYKWCAVPYCGSSSLRTPEKLFIRVPLEKKMRNKWLQMARRDPHLISLKTKLWFCESHFNLEEDMENYMEYKLMGSVKRIRINPKCIPCKFECLPNFWKGTFTSPPRFAKKPRIIEKTIETECLGRYLFMEAVQVDSPSLILVRTKLRGRNTLSRILQKQIVGVKCDEFNCKQRIIRFY